MMDHPWISVAMLGVAIFGFAWMTPKRSREEQAEGGGSDPAYDRLLEELETENRELLDAVTKFKQEQDETIKGLVDQIHTLERQVKEMASQSAAATAAASPMPGQAAADAVAVSANETAAPAPAAPAAPALAQPASKAEVERAGSAAVLPTAIRDRYADLLALHRKGRSIEQIAKSVGMNKGEVQLILQLARREEEQFA